MRNKAKLKKNGQLEMKVYLPNKKKKLELPREIVVILVYSSPIFRNL